MIREMTLNYDMRDVLILFTEIPIVGCETPNFLASSMALKPNFLTAQ